MIRDNLLEKSMPTIKIARKRGRTGQRMGNLKSINILLLFDTLGTWIPNDLVRKTANREDVAVVIANVCNRSGTLSW